jgi:hypothetical protein
LIKLSSPLMGDIPDLDANPTVPDQHVHRHRLDRSRLRWENNPASTGFCSFATGHSSGIDRNPVGNRKIEAARASTRVADAWANHGVDRPTRRHESMPVMRGQVRTVCAAV